MLTTLRIAGLFARRQDGDRLLSVLPIASFSIVTALLLIVVGGSRALLSLRGDDAAIYALGTIIALTLLMIPLLTLGAAAAKLAARRRDARLSSLRLLGATDAQITGLTLLEAAGNAVIGGLIGTLGYAALVPLVGMVPFAGAPIGAALWLPFRWLPVVWLVLAAIAAGSAALGMRGVLVSPLGVRTRQRPALVTGRRAVVAVGLAVFAIVMVTGLTGITQVAGIIGMIVAVFTALAFGLLALDAIGPWYFRIRANRAARSARDVERLLAARMTLENPVAAWRQVSGLAVTTFVGVISGAGLGLIAMVNRAAGPDTEVPHAFNDLATGVYLTLAIAFVMVACTVAINQAAMMLDRSRVQVSLDRLGVPQQMLARASRKAVMSNVLAVVVGAAALSLVLVFPLVGATAVTNPTALVTMVAVFVAGVLVVRLGASVAGRLVPGILAKPDRVL